MAPEAPIIVVCSDQSEGSSGQTLSLFPLSVAAFEELHFDVFNMTNCCVFGTSASFDLLKLTSALLHGIERGTLIFDDKEQNM